MSGSVASNGAARSARSTGGSPYAADPPWHARPTPVSAASGARALSTQPDLRTSSLPRSPTPARLYGLP
eukprot:9754456-Lingulodinium_polyedra.AAC.1